MILINDVKNNFKYPDIKRDDFKFGTASEFTGLTLREDGDWRDYTPPYEFQRRNGVESSACFVEACQHAVATLQEEMFNLVDQNYSARFNLMFSNASPNGGSPLDAANSFRKQGLIPESLLPFSDDIKSWEEFNSFKGGNEKGCLSSGKLWLKRWALNYDIVFTRDESIEQKMSKLRQALKYSPCPISVYGWVKQGDDYIKPQGSDDNHLVLCVYLDKDNCPWILDTYEPFVKKLKANYNSDFAMRFGIARIPETKGDGFWELLKKIFSYFK